MSICQVCGAWAPDDPETGYSEDGPCPSCQSAGWTRTAEGALIREGDEAEEIEINEFEQVRR